MTSKLFCSVGLCVYPSISLAPRPQYANLSRIWAQDYPQYAMVMIYAYFNTQILSFANLGSVYMLASFPDPVRLLVACSTEFDFPFPSGESLGSRLLTCSIAKTEVALLMNTLCKLNRSKHVNFLKARTSTSKWQKYKCTMYYFL